MPATLPEPLVRRQVLLELAVRCETEVASFALEAAIATAIGFYTPIPDWTRPRRTTPNYTTSLSDARRLSTWLLLHASDVDGSHVMLGDPNSTPTRKVAGIGGRTLELTWCAAALRARAEEIDDG